MTDWNLYRQLERLLAREFCVDLVSRDGIAIRDPDGRELWITAQEQQAVPLETAAGWPWGVPT